MIDRDELIVTLHVEGAYCGNCAFDGLALCSDCRTVLGRYADRLIGDGWVKMPSREAIQDVISAALGDALLCTRVWAAWAVDTMTEDDFQNAADDPAWVSEFTDAILALLAGETS